VRKEEEGKAVPTSSYGRPLLSPALLVFSTKVSCLKQEPLEASRGRRSAQDYIELFFCNQKKKQKKISNENYSKFYLMKNFTFFALKNFI